MASAVREKNEKYITKNNCKKKQKKTHKKVEIFLAAFKSPPEIKAS